LVQLGALAGSSFLFRELSMTSQNFSELPTLADREADETAPGDACLELSERQQAGLEMILAGATDTAVAAALQLSRRTIYAWRVENETFAAELRRRRSAIYQNHVDRLRSLLGRSIDVLERQVAERYAPTSHRAAKTLLSLTGVGKAVAEKMPEIKQVPGVAKTDTTGTARSAHESARQAEPAVTRFDETCRDQAPGAASSHLPRSTQKVLSKAIDAVQALGWG
jgi:hypothetical protein